MKRSLCAFVDLVASHFCLIKEITVDETVHSNLF